MSGHDRVIRQEFLGGGAKTMQSSILKAMCVFLMGLVIMLVSGHGAAAQSEYREARLVGTWRVQVTQVDCVTGAPTSPTPFSSLLTFAIGGTMAEDTTNPAFAPGQRSAGQGTWDHKDRRTYGARSVAFINYTTPRIRQRTTRDLRRVNRRSRKASRSRAIPTHGQARPPSNLRTPPARSTGKDVPWQVRSGFENRTAPAISSALETW